MAATPVLAKPSRWTRASPASTMGRRFECAGIGVNMTGRLDAVKPRSRWRRIVGLRDLEVTAPRALGAREVAVVQVAERRQLRLPAEAVAGEPAVGHGEAHVLEWDVGDPAVGPV